MNKQLRLPGAVTGLFTAAAVLITLFLQGCSPVKGYPGPELPETQISAIFLNYDSDTAEINQAGIEGTAFGAAGIHVLPGKHLFDMEITVKEQADNCYSYPQMDDYGYDSCLRKKDHGKCDCYDFLSVYERCHRQVRDGTCSGKFKTSAGRQYDIRLEKHGRSASAAVYERSSFDQAGKGECSMGEWRTETEDEYVGSGRYTANANGIYRCY